MSVSLELLVVRIRERADKMATKGNAVALREAADALEGAASELERLRARERTCPTMAEAESRALLRALQECAALLGLPESASPARVVEAVSALRTHDDMLLRLARFAAYVIRAWHNNGERGGVDGGELQGAAEIFGIVSKFEVPAGGCGESCVCVVDGATEGDFCYPLKDDVFELVYGGDEFRRRCE